MDAALLAREFPHDSGLIYLNHAGVSPWPTRTAVAVERFARENARHGARDYRGWLERERALREQLRRLVNAPSADDIALVKNTSEALSMVAGGIDWRFGDNVVSATEEFPSNRYPWQAQQRFGVEFRQVDLGRAESPEDALMKACDAHTRVLTISSIQYGTGRRVDLARLGSFCRERNILFCVDAIQSIGAVKLDIQAIQADFVMADAHKWLLGPEGIALFYCRAERRCELQLHEYGWHMAQDHLDYERQDWRPAASARRFECGSPNMLGIHALAASLSLFEELGMDRIERAVLDHTGHLLERLAEYPSIQLLTPRAEHARGGIVSFRMAGRSSAEIHQALLARGALGAHRFGAVRLSPHFYIRREQLDLVLEMIASLI
jgi:selenocysteine lyase/cysteine desulfurase